MLYQISGKQIDIGAALQTHVKSVVDAIASKYAERPALPWSGECRYHHHHLLLPLASR